MLVVFVKAFDCVAETYWNTLTLQDIEKIFLTDGWERCREVNQDQRSVRIFQIQTSSLKVYVHYVLQQEAVVEEAPLILATNTLGKSS